jgi:hypothetical protein
VRQGKSYRTNGLASFSPQAALSDDIYFVRPQPKNFTLQSRQSHVPETGLYKSQYQLLQPYGSFADFHGTPIAARCMIFGSSNLKWVKVLNYSVQERLNKREQLREILRECGISGSYVFTISTLVPTSSGAKFILFNVSERRKAENTIPDE